jgi:NifU-like protein
MLHTGTLSAARAASVTLSQRQGVGRAGSRACGQALRVALVLSGDEEVVTQLTLDAVGTVGAFDAERIRASLVGRTAQDTLLLSHRDLAPLLGGLPESNMYCSVLLAEALRAAIHDCRSEPSFCSSESTVACRCFAVAEGMIRRAVRMNGLESLCEVTRYTRAAGGCGLCAEQVEAVLTHTRAELTPEFGSVEPNSGNETVPPAESWPHE